ncbi:T9SS type A sorting domain-containing protein, partial [Oceanihabitans sp.]|nr:T9SS type A sorting domain-containing protein [Oceanihabitans sp.]
ECAETSTQDVTVLDSEDASFTMTATCDGGTATITGNAGGTFAFSPVPGDGAVIDPVTGTITGGLSGMTYTIIYTTSGPCSENSTEDVTVLDSEDASFTMTATCDGGTATIIGDAGGTFAFSPEPGDGAIIDPVTGTITNGLSGATYTIAYTTSGPCSESSTEDVTVLDAEDASFTLTPICNEATALITGDVGGTFAFNPEPGDGAILDSTTGNITNGTYGSSYTVEYTTSGPCPASLTQTVTLEDTVPPLANAQDITVQLDDTGNVTITADDINNDSTDDCGIVSITIDIDSFTCENVGENTVTLTVTDVGGNISTATATVTVEDNVSPEATCNDITVDLDSTGGYTLSTEDIDAIALGSSDACGIESLSVSQDSFTCDSIGENTVTLTIIDVNGNETTCESIITVFGIIPTVTIIETQLSEFCEGVILTAEGDDIDTYEWTTGEDTDTILVLENGTYGVTVTSSTGCTAYEEFTVTSIEEGAPISDYTIVATNDVFLHGNNSVESGGVGVTSSNGEIKLHQSSHIEGFGQAENFTLNHGSTIGEEINEPANPLIPEFIYNTLSRRDSPSVTIPNGETQTLDGDVYDLIWVREGATVIFSQSNVFVNRIKTSQQATIEFVECANVYVNDMFMLAKYGTINANENAVAFYVNNDVHIEKGSNVHGIIYSNGRQILAKGSNVNSNNPEPTYMTGLFIADKVHGINEVIWNSADICAPCPLYNDEDNRVINFDVVAWPNPSNTVFNLRLRTFDFSNGAEVNVFDMSGKLVHSGTFQPKQQYSFGPELEGGVYIVKVKQGKDLKVLRLIKY